MFSLISNLNTAAYFKKAGLSLSEKRGKLLLCNYFSEISFERSHCFYFLTVLFLTIFFRLYIVHVDAIG